MILKEKSSYKDPTKKILNKMPGINKWQYVFMIEILGLYLSIKGRINFLQLGRYGKHGEQRYRSRFAKAFDFLFFNTEIVSRLCDDADLLYKYTGEQKKGRGRPRKYDGKVAFDDLKKEHFECLEENEKCRIYQGTVYSKSLKRDINLVVVQSLKKGKWEHKLYFCTDLDLPGKTLLIYYRKRFQIEFVFRDAKQYTGLDHCQARKPEKLYFHWNASLTSVNLAKASHWLPVPKQERGAFSMADIKTLYNNDLLLQRFLYKFG